MNIHCLVPYHLPLVLATVPNQPWITKVPLGDLVIDPPEFQDNRLGEGRLFLSDPQHPPEAEWVGVLNARCPTKYLGFDWNKLDERIAPVLRTPQDVAICWPTINDHTNNWLEYTEHIHPGMSALLLNLAQYGRFQISTRAPSLWGNDFICHRTVWDKWLKFWLSSFTYFHALYGFDPPFQCDPKYGNRKPALLYERVTTLFFALERYQFHTITSGVVI